MLVPYQRGGYPVFVGRAYQKGRGFGSIMSSVFRNLVVPAAKSVGKNLLKTGLRKASNVMRGVADGKNVKEAMFDEVPEALTAIIKPGRGRPRKQAPRGRVGKRGRGSRGRGRPAKYSRSDIFS